MKGAESKYASVVREVRKKIRDGTYAPGARLPGQFALAREHGVSAITANRALNELEQMGLVARRERSGTFVLERPRVLSEIVTVVEKVPVTVSLQAHDYWRGITERAESLKIPSQILSASDPVFQARVFEEGRGQGVILLGSENPELVAGLTKAEIPFVVAGTLARHAPHCVLENRRGAAIELTRTLARAGCQRIAFVGNLTAPNHRLARDGYVEEMAALHREAGRVVDASEERIVEATRALLAAPGSPDALLVMGGQLPFSVVTVLMELRDRPKLGVFAESPAVLRLRPIAYVAAYSQVEVGVLAVDMLHDVALGRLTCAAAHYAPFEILTPGDSPSPVLAAPASGLERA